MCTGTSHQFGQRTKTLEARTLISTCNTAILPALRMNCIVSDTARYHYSAKYRPRIAVCVLLCAHAQARMYGLICVPESQRLIIENHFFSSRCLFWGGEQLRSSLSFAPPSQAKVVVRSPFSTHKAGTWLEYGQRTTRLWPPSLSW